MYIYQVSQNTRYINIELLHSFLHGETFPKKEFWEIIGSLCGSSSLNIQLEKYDPISVFVGRSYVYSGVVFPNAVIGG